MFDRAQLLSWWLQPLQALEKRAHIPVGFSLAQFAHESLWGDDNQGSQLALEFNNWAGMKYRAWMREYGAYPVLLKTQEEYAGVLENVEDHFAAFPDTGRFLEAYEALLTSDHYLPAMEWNHDPILYGLAIWELGYATDSAYILGVIRRYREFQLWDL